MTSLLPSSPADIPQISSISPFSLLIFALDYGERTHLTNHVMTEVASSDLDHFIPWVSLWDLQFLFVFFFLWYILPIIDSYTWDHGGWEIVLKVWECSLIDRVLACMKPWVQSPAWHKIETGNQKSEVILHPWLHRKFEHSMGHRIKGKQSRGGEWENLESIPSPNPYWVRTSSCA